MKRNMNVYNIRFDGEPERPRKLLHPRIVKPPSSFTLLNAAKLFKSRSMVKAGRVRYHSNTRSPAVRKERTQPLNTSGPSITPPDTGKVSQGVGTQLNNNYYPAVEYAEQEQEKIHLNITLRNPTQIMVSPQESYRKHPSPLVLRQERINPHYSTTKVSSYMQSTTLNVFRTHYKSEKKAATNTPNRILSYSNDSPKALTESGGSLSSFMNLIKQLHLNSSISVLNLTMKPPPEKTMASSNSIFPARNPFRMKSMYRRKIWETHTQPLIFSTPSNLEFFLHSNPPQRTVKKGPLYLKSRMNTATPHRIVKKPQ